MNPVLVAIVFLLAFYVTATYGISRAFMVVYLPSLLFLGGPQQLDQLHFMALTAVSAPLYGIAAGAFLSREPIRIRFSWLDGVIVLLGILGILSDLQNMVVNTGIGPFFQAYYSLLGPYFLARIALSNPQARQAGLKTLVICACILAALGLYEMRMRPYFVYHMFAKFGFKIFIQNMAYYRFNFIRAAGTMGHPIYFGNLSLTLFFTIILLAKTTGRRLNEPFVLAGIFAALIALCSSLSFGPLLLGSSTALCFWLMIRYLPGGRIFLIPAVLIIIVSLFSYSYLVAQQVEAKVEGNSDIERSYEQRNKIIRYSWSLAVSAPMLGHGSDLHWEEESITSVDNAYLMFAITLGPLYLFTFISIAIVYAARTSWALGWCHSKSDYTAIAAATAGTLAIMVAMYTVWAGSYYFQFWLCILGFGTTLADLVQYPQVPAVPRQSPTSNRSRRQIPSFRN